MHFVMQTSSAVAVAGRILRKHRYDHGFNGRIPNLSDLPPELSIQVLSHLNATDLCLAACVWQQLATDEILWSGLCRSKRWLKRSYWFIFLHLGLSQS